MVVKSEYMTATGQILCNGVPVKYAKVSLMDADTDFDDVFGTTKTDVNGNFQVSGSADDIWGAGAPDPYIMVEYYYSGYYGTLNVQDGILIKSTASDETSENSYASTINFGVINFNNEKCKTYVNMLTAIIDYYTRTTLKLPMSTLYVALEEILSGSTPYSNDNTIHVPINYNNDTGLNLFTCKHELAHTIRHTYDGSYAHFLSDAISYSYLQYHKCSSQTNYGFAFNEGWSEYWSGDCTGNTGTDYTIEGNVASALRKLKTTCSSSDYRFVNILKLYPGSIHSFSEFNNKHYSVYGCKL